MRSAMRVHRRLAVSAIVLTGFLTLLTFRVQPATAQAGKIDWLPLCGKCMKPTIFSKSGIGTAHAIAKARVTYQGAKEHCENWSFASTPDCDKQAKETLKEEKGKIYTASADCVHGKLTITTGESFVYAGLWPSGYLKGKTRWRWGPGSWDDTGKVVGMEGPTRAPMVSATSEILCPAGITAKGRPR